MKDYGSQIKTQADMFFNKYDDHTLSSQGHLQRINLLAAILSFTEELIGDGGCVLSDFFSGHDVYSKSREQRTSI